MNNDDSVHLWTRKKCEHFIKDTQKGVWNYIMSLTGDINNVDDLTQITFQKWFRIFSEKSTPYTDARNYLFRIAYTTVVDRYRRSLTEKRTLKDYCDHLRGQSQLRSPNDWSEEILNVIQLFLNEPNVSERKKEILRLWSRWHRLAF